MTKISSENLKALLIEKLSNQNEINEIISILDQKLNFTIPRYMVEGMLIYRNIYIPDHVDMDSFTEDLNIYANKCLINFLNEIIQQYVYYPKIKTLTEIVNDYIDYFFTSTIYTLTEDKYIYQFSYYIDPNRKIIDHVCEKYNEYNNENYIYIDEDLIDEYYINKNDINEITKDEKQIIHNEITKDEKQIIHNEINKYYINVKQIIHNKINKDEKQIIHNEINKYYINENQNNHNEINKDYVKEKLFKYNQINENKSNKIQFNLNQINKHYLNEKFFAHFQLYKKINGVYINEFLFNYIRINKKQINKKLIIKTCILIINNLDEKKLIKIRINDKNTYNILQLNKNYNIEKHKKIYKIYKFFKFKNLKNKQQKTGIG